MFRKMSKDWVGNSKTTFVQLGASSHSEGERETNDYYATDPDTLKIFLKALQRDNLQINKDVWECACGEGHLSEVLVGGGYIVKSTDLINRNYGTPYIDFLKETEKWHGDILTNPPYKYAKEFVEHSLELIEDGQQVIMLLKIQFLEGKDRRKFFEKYPPKYVYVNSTRQTCYLNGNMSKKLSSASCYCWFIWEKGFTGEPLIRWV